VLVLAALLAALIAGALVEADRPAGAQAQPATATAVVGSAPAGRALPGGFVGLSFEYSALPLYTGAGAVDPVLVRLIANLVPGQSPVLRIGGDSTDTTWWPVPGIRRPPVVDYNIDRSWLHDAAGLALALRARLVVGINLAIDSPALAAAEARALIAGIGRKSIAALEVGNEPDLYTIFPAYRNARGQLAHVRGRGYDFAVFMRQFTAVRRALPRLALAGPALGGLPWAGRLASFIAGQPGVTLATMHLYPLLGCTAPPGSPLFPTVAHLLSDASTTGLAEGAAPSARLAHRHGLAFRVDELNSVTCGGTAGISNTFASALWMLDTLFAFDQAGVDGVNVHMFPGALYAPFALSESGGSWTAWVRPDYYAMLMFARAAPPGSRLLPVTSSASGSVKVWATLARDGTIRVVLINWGTSPIPLQLSAPRGASGAAAMQQLLAPRLGATSGVTLAGQSFDPSTATGVLTGTPSTSTVPPAVGPYAPPGVTDYTITLPGASATMLTWNPRG
jgi:hypothetical protein